MHVDITKATSIIKSVKKAINNKKSNKDVKRKNTKPTDTTPQQTKEQKIKNKLDKEDWHKTYFFSPFANLITKEK